MADQGVLRAVLIAAGTIEDAMQRLKASKRQISAELAQAIATLDWADPALLTELLNVE